VFAGVLGGVLVGLLFAIVISASVGGSDAKTPAGSTRGSPTNGESQRLQDLQHRDAVRDNEVVESRDVRVSGCGVDVSGYASADVLISNGTSDTATYYVRIAFVSAKTGRLLSDDVASVHGLPAGESAPVQTVHSIDRAPDGGVLCRLASVSRF
jgi:hypothetical protein